MVKSSSPMQTANRILSSKSERALSERDIRLRDHFYKRALPLKKHPFFSIKNLIVVFLLLIAFAPLSEAMPTGRESMAFGYLSRPNGLLLRMPFDSAHILDIVTEIPRITTGAANGIESGIAIGYTIFLSEYKNIGLVLRPNIGYRYNSQAFYRNMLYLGAMAGIEVFMEDLGISNTNLIIGLHTGSRLGFDTGRSSFSGPLLGDDPFGVTVGFAYYF